MFKKEINKNELLLIAANLFPVFGVWFLGWSATGAFIVYALETMIVGILTVIKMMVSTIAPKDDPVYYISLKSGLIFMSFFIFHFGLFALVQTTIFSQAANITPPGSGPMHFFFHFYSYINEDIAYMLGAFIIGYISKSFIPFILSGDFKTKPLMGIMFEPYGRIFVQQFTVILGSMFLNLGLGKVFVLVFAVIKIAIEIIINYDNIANKSMAEMKKESAK